MLEIGINKTLLLDLQEDTDFDDDDEAIDGNDGESKDRGAQVWALKWSMGHANRNKLCSNKGAKLGSRLRDRKQRWTDAYTCCEINKCVRVNC